LGTAEVMHLKKAEVKVGLAAQAMSHTAAAGPNTLVTKFKEHCTAFN
jgi:hypothetical protein